jgi:hypothetical protein
LRITPKSAGNLEVALGTHAKELMTPYKERLSPAKNAEEVNRLLSIFEIVSALSAVQFFGASKEIRRIRAIRG